MAKKVAKKGDEKTCEKEYPAWTGTHSVIL